MRVSATRPGKSSSLDEVATLLLQETGPLKSLTYDGAYEVFYGTPEASPDAVVQISAVPGGGVPQVMFGAGSQASRLLGEASITSLHYASNTGTIFVLSTSLGLLFEATLSGDLKGTNVLESWFPLESYQYCGAWQYEGFSSGNIQLADMAINQFTRTVWGLASDGSLMEYSLQGDLLRHITAMTLHSVGLFGTVTSLAWMEGPKLLLGMQTGNRLAVINTAPDELVSSVPLLLTQRSGAIGVKVAEPVVDGLEADLLEPPGEDFEQEVVRAFNSFVLESVVTLRMDRHPHLMPHTLGSLAFDRASGRVLYSTSATSGYAVGWTYVDGLDGGLIISKQDTPVDALVYSPVLGGLLLWCESCGSLAEVSTISGEQLSSRTFYSFTSMRPSARAEALAMTPDGSLLIIGTRAGEVSFYCSDGSEVQDSSFLLKSVTDSDDPSVGPYYFWQSRERSASARAAAGKQPGPIPEEFPGRLDAKDRGHSMQQSVNFAALVEEQYHYLDNIDCHGEDIGPPLEGVTLLECQRLCDRSPQCTAYTTHLRLRDCYLKRSCWNRVDDYSATSAISLVGTKSMEDKNHMASRSASQAKPREVAISGELVKDAATPHVYLYVDNTGCGDGVLHEIPNVPLSECESICTADIACGVYTYRVPERSCAIRSTCTLPNPASFTDFTAIKVPAESVSGLAALSNAPAQPTFLSYTYIQLVGCKDPHFQVLRDVPQSACELACSSEVRCRAYTYNTDRNDCYLKETCTDVEAVDVDVSAFKDGESLLCANTAGTVHLRWANIGQAATCLSSSGAVVTGPLVCTTVFRLDTITVPEEGMRATCTAALPALPIPSQEAPTQPPVGDSPTISLTYTYMEGVGCKDPHFQVLRDVQQSACESACSSEDRCHAYTFNTGRNDCYLKEICRDVEAVGADVSGFRDGDYTYMESVGCMDPHFEVLRDVQQTTCESACSAEERCSAYTYNTDPADSDPGASLEGGWQWSGQDCEPWEDRQCGLGSGPGLKIDGITWYRMYAHNANPLRNGGGGEMHWTPFRERRDYGGMYYKGSEIIGYFDRPIRISEVGDRAEISFLWQSEGEIQAGLCPASDARDIDCERCEEVVKEQAGYKHIYHEIPRDYPGGYAATAASSWIRSNLDPDFINARGLVCDFVETPELGDRSFKERMFDPAEDGACLNLPNGEWTPDDKPFTMKLTLRDRGSGRVRFTWTMEFNGWSASKTETWDHDLFPDQIDSVVIGYTNPRSFTSLKLKRVT
eukprot:jgi/Tetstr1/425935/TSEL_016287.t1